MTLDDMRIFVAIVNTGSFTAAADRLMLSKQFVSRRIGALETGLAAQLLVRNTRSLSVTDAGQVFFQHASRILDEVRQAEDAISLRQSQLVGNFKISLPHTYGLRHIAPLLTRFQHQHLSVSLHIEINDRFVDLIGEGFDMVLRIGALADSSMIARQLGILPMVICGSPDYLQQTGIPLLPADLSRHRCLRYGTAGPSGWNLLVEGKSRFFAINGPVSSNNGEVLRESAEAGLGLVLLPRFIVNDAINAGRLLPVLADFTPQGLSLNAIYPGHRQHNPVIRALLAFISPHITASHPSGEQNGILPA
ncbi:MULTISPECIES: LysR family transcriptional regulator [Tatumella]|uniref:LysR substrate-binding domain-containing protein n=1 Tax=Tatumella punctata TaxID=399969 RepID=A0ABW1VME6_9GAMM|nr:MULTISPECIES: LysR family transcriptional regulator [unclassified Tatumella]MBS0854846.1 LysR family transcriptional regulator [Tatumella sp. JGM16]MBS0876467.1 LysR family transcriptional regulator [Tatumella sp. JGM82]MBS0889640.1 LysR family transcriptional regulator [Tatumella sp. JGM94]MBS0893002.1 LysR family transcriptional regulator [Tatumella sp. JGM130]MBS0900762.1 LysR family transcriptional regulator [Tatumella sp. JGM100]